MSTAKTVWVVVPTLIFVGLSGVVVSAQEKGEIKRNILMKQDLGSVPGHDAVLGQVEIAPGASEAKHTHPGELLGYVQQGTLTLYVEGNPTKTVQQGQSFFIPANTVHWGANEGKEPVKVLATMVLEKGKPPTSPAK